MMYKPGSFSKNFGWKDQGFRKLYGAIRRGFKKRLVQVKRESFLTNSQLNQYISLLPANFFLHNKNGYISVDELVYQSVILEFSEQFNHLGLFAFHMSNVGCGGKIVSNPAGWANEFVRDRLYGNGGWQTNRLGDTVLSNFLDSRLDAKPEVRRKCLTNYRHLFKLCGYLPTSLDQINSRSEQWITAALFLTWDRHILDGGSPVSRDLVKLCNTMRIHSLIGVSSQYVDSYARHIAREYNLLGGLDRFSSYISRVGDTSEPDNLADLGSIQDDIAAERRIATHIRQLRNRKYVAELKRIYDNTCVFCNTKLQVGRETYYSEVAHIKPLGSPHSGPDIPSNMLVLCMHHHLQFDRGVLTISESDGVHRIRSLIHGDPLHGRTIELRHNIRKKFIEWHQAWFKSMSDK